MKKTHITLIGLCFYANLVFAVDPDKIVNAGQEVPLSATATDSDCHFKPPPCPYPEPDTAITITWSAVWKNSNPPVDAGSFKNGDNTGPSVTWIAPCSGDVTIIATADNSQSTKAIDGNASDSIWARVLGFTARFFESPSQEYGFDDFSDMSYPRKSIWADTGAVGTDKVYIDVSPSGSDTYLVTEDASIVTVSPEQTSSTTLLTLAVQNETPCPGGKDISAHCINPTGGLLANMLVKSYDHVFKTLKIHYIANSGDDVQVIAEGQSGTSSTDICVSAGSDFVLNTYANSDDYVLNGAICVGDNLVCDSTANNKSIPVTYNYYTGLDNYLNDTVFCQAVAALTITRELLVEECPYDLNGNGELDYWGATANQERQIIQNLLGPFDPEEKHIFIVGRIEAYAGFAVDLGSRDAFVSQRSLLGERSEQDMMYIIAHELGHSFGCLPDLDVNVDCLTTPGVDPENLMSYCNQGQHMAAPALRYGQWDLLQQSNPQN